MKKTLRLIIAISLVACMAFSMVACFAPKLAQGVDTENHVIHVGNTAATTGSSAFVGIPFKYAQEAYFWYYTTQTEGYKDADGNKAISNYITSLYEKGEEIPLLQSVQTNGVAWDWMKPCYHSTITYQCDVQNDL